jgi:predicted DNA-binding antitoxin AbrB/MazE fold protein
MNPQKPILRMGVGLSKIIRVRYEKGVLKPLEPLDLEEGEELVVFIRKHRISDVLDKYVGLFGKASVEELKKYEEEAQAQ